MSGGTSRLEPGRKQPDLGDRADAVATSQWTHTQDRVLISKLCLDNDNRLPGTILKRLDGAARKMH
jgi:hypothetical protein